MSKDLKELLNYFGAILAAMTLPLLSSFFYIPDSISGLDCFVWFFGFLIFSAVSLISVLIITILAIIKSKGRYLRTFFDDTSYSTILFLFIVAAWCITACFGHENINEYIIQFMCGVCLFSVVSFGILLRNIKKTIFFTVMMLIFIVIIPVVLNHYWYDDFLLYLSIFIGINYLLIYFTILIYNLCKFIKSKQQKH